MFALAGEHIEAGWPGTNDMKSTFLKSFEKSGDSSISRSDQAFSRQQYGLWGNSGRWTRCRPRIDSISNTSGDIWILFKFLMIPNLQNSGPIWRIQIENAVSWTPIVRSCSNSQIQCTLKCPTRFWPQSLSAPLVTASVASTVNAMWLWRSHQNEESLVSYITMTISCPMVRVQLPRRHSTESNTAPPILCSTATGNWWVHRMATPRWSTKRRRPLRGVSALQRSRRMRSGFGMRALITRWCSSSILIPCSVQVRTQWNGQSKCWFLALIPFRFRLCITLWFIRLSP